MGKVVREEARGAGCYVHKGEEVGSDVWHIFDLPQVSDIDGWCIGKVDGEVSFVQIVEKFNELEWFHDGKQGM